MVRRATTSEHRKSDRPSTSRGPVPIEATPITALTLPRPRVRRPASSVLLVGRWFAADVHASLAVALGVPVLVVEAVHGLVGSGPVLAFAAGYLGLQVGLGLVLGRARRGVVGVARLLLAVAFVGGLQLIEPRAEATLPVLYVQIIVLAAAM